MTASDKAPAHTVVIPFWLDRPVLEAMEIAANADRLGFEELWVGEMMTFDAFALAAAIASATKRVRLCVGPLAIGLRDPASLALGIQSVATLGARPAHLALGASTPAVVSGWHGRSWRHNVERMEEMIAALRPLLAGERSKFHGRYVRSDGFRLQTPMAATRLAVAAFGPRMVQTAARLADRVVVNLVTPEQVARFREQVEAAAKAAGVPPPPIVAWIPCALNPDEGAYAQLARQLVVYVAPPGYGEMFIEAGFGDVVTLARSGAHPREVLAAMPRALIEAISAVGDEAAVRRKLDAFTAAGAATVAIVPVTAHDAGGSKILQALAE